jgi:1-deoxy-D-xylulose-5-phosphate reductoisomerase
MTNIRRISILGATGSVGQATLDLIGRAEAGYYQVVALTARTNALKLASLAIEHGAECVALADRGQADVLRDALSSHPHIAIGIGDEAIVEAATREADWIMAAIVGAAGLRPTLAALRQGSHLAFANKECLVCSGALFMDEAKRHGTRLLPVDSEHNAIFQVFDQDQRHAIQAITLTASGGPFRDWSLDQMKTVTRKDALSHPTWEMGAKITIDSATMMNKGLEIIEACWLFGLDQSMVDVVVHPQSIIHGLVEYSDGSVLAQLGSPDMRTPIASALAWPERMAAPVHRLSLSQLSRLDFEAPDPVRFPALRLARDVIEVGGCAPAVLNAANEIAVASFLNGTVGFLDIARCVEESLERSVTDADMPSGLSAFDDVFAIDRRARTIAQDIIAAMAVKV